MHEEVVQVYGDPNINQIFEELELKQAVLPTGHHLDLLTLLDPEDGQEEELVNILRQRIHELFVHKRPQQDLVDILISVLPYTYDIQVYIIHHRFITGPDNMYSELALRRYWRRSHKRGQSISSSACVICLPSIYDLLNEAVKKIGAER